MTGGKRSRQKGDRGERLIVNMFQDAGIGAERVPLSGAAGGSFIGDITIPINGADWLAESKVRATGWVKLYEWIAPVKLLFVRSDRNQPLVLMRASDLVELVKACRREGE